MENNELLAHVEGLRVKASKDEELYQNIHDTLVNGYKNDLDTARAEIAPELQTEQGKVTTLTAEKQVLADKVTALEAQVTGLGETPVTKK